MLEFPELPIAVNLKVGICSIYILWLSGKAYETHPYLLNSVSQREHCRYFELGDRLQETAVHIYVDVLCAF